MVITFLQKVFQQKEEETRKWLRELRNRLTSKALGEFSALLISALLNNQRFDQFLFFVFVNLLNYYTILSWVLLFIISFTRKGSLFLVKFRDFIFWRLICFSFFSLFLSENCLTFWDTRLVDYWRLFRFTGSSFLHSYESLSF